MKNYDEFRATVFDKAKKYEAQRKARNRKIVETVSLCSLVIVITLSAYLGILTIPEQLTEQTTDTTVHTVESTTSTTTTESTTATETSTERTQHTATETTATEPTAETTTASSIEEVTESTTVMSKLEFRGTAKETNFAIGETELLEIETFEEWNSFHLENLDDYPNLQNSGSTLDTEYFEQHTLVVVKYTGYDIIAFEYHFAPAADEEETYTLQITLRKNPKNKREQIYVMSVEKESFQYAEIRVLEK